MKIGEKLELNYFGRQDYNKLDEKPPKSQEQNLTLASLFSQALVSLTLYKLELQPKIPYFYHSIFTSLKNLGSD